LLTNLLFSRFFTIFVFDFVNENHTAYVTVSCIVSCVCGRHLIKKFYVLSLKPIFSINHPQHT